MRSNNRGTTRFMLRRNLFIGVAVFLIVFFTLVLWGLSHIPNEKGSIMENYPHEDIPRALTALCNRGMVEGFGNMEWSCMLFGGMGFLTALLLMRHLFSRRQGMLQSSLPEKRENDFLRRSLCYLALCALPIVAGFALYLLTLLFNGLFPYVEWGTLLARMGMLLVVNLYGFCVGLLCCTLTGTWWAAILAGAVLLVGFEAAVYMWDTISGLYLHTKVSGEFVDNMMEVFPIVTLYKGVCKPADWRWVPGVVSILVSFGAAFLLYRSRKTESAEKTLAFSWLENVMIFLLSLLGGTLMGLVLLYSFATEWSLVAGFLIGALLICWVCRMVFHQRFCGLGKGWILAGAAVILLSGGLFALHNDVFGYDSYMPDREKLTAITVRPTHYKADSQCFTLSSPEMLDTGYSWLTLLRDEVNHYENGLYEATKAETQSMVVVTYHMGDKTVMRRYPNDKVRTAAQPYLETIAESSDFEESLLAYWNMEEETIHSITIRGDFRYLSGEKFHDRFGPYTFFDVSLMNSPERLMEIMEGYKKDMRARSFADMKQPTLLIMDVTVRPKENEYRYFGLPVYATDVNVLRAIFGDKTEELLAYATGGYAADEDVIALTVKYSASRQQLQKEDMGLYVESITPAASPEQAAEWAGCTVTASDLSRWYMPDYEAESYSTLYLYSKENVLVNKQYQDPEYQLPEDVTTLYGAEYVPTEMVRYYIGK